MNWQRFRTLMDFIILVAFVYLSFKIYTTEGTSGLFWVFFIFAVMGVVDLIYNLWQIFRNPKS